MVIKRALLNTGCIVENEDTGALSRKYESNEYSNPIVERMQQMPINYEIYQEPESIKVPDDYISKGRPGSVSNPLSGGAGLQGSFSRIVLSIHLLHIVMYCEELNMKGSSN